MLDRFSDKLSIFTSYYQQSLNHRQRKCQIIPKLTFAKFYIHTVHTITTSNFNFSITAWQSNIRPVDTIQRFKIETDVQDSFISFSSWKLPLHNTVIHNQPKFPLDTVLCSLHSNNIYSYLKSLHDYLFQFPEICSKKFRYCIRSCQFERVEIWFLQQRLPTSNSMKYHYTRYDKDSSRMVM